MAGTSSCCARLGVHVSTNLIVSNGDQTGKFPQAARHSVAWLGIPFDRQTYSKLRRRIIRIALRRNFRTAEASFRSANELLPAEINRILICRPNHRLGNLLLLTPLIADIGRVLPDAKIDIVLAGAAGPELFQSFANVEHIYGLSRRMIRHPISIMRTLRQIRRARYDLAIDPCAGSQSGRFLLSVAKARHAIGIPVGDVSADSRWAIAARQAPAHMAHWPVFWFRNALSQKRTGCDDDYSALNIGLTEMERRWARQVLNSLTYVEGKSRATVIVGIFADATGAKRYDESWWLSFVAEMLSRNPNYVIVEIAPPDGLSRLGGRFKSFSNPSPRAVAAMISNMTCFVSADCGVMHLACASGTPTIGLFSVTDAATYAPYGGYSRAIETNRKTPQEVARLAISIVEAVNANMNPVTRETSHEAVVEN